MYKISYKKNTVLLLYVSATLVAIFRGKNYKQWIYYRRF